jgi:hypothetical protein
MYLCYGRLQMDLEDLAERLRHEMELITETELVLGPTTLSHFIICRWNTVQLRNWGFVWEFI